MDLWCFADKAPQHKPERVLVAPAPSKKTATGDATEETAVKTTRATKATKTTKATKATKAAKTTSEAAKETTAEDTATATTAEKPKRTRKTTAKATTKRKTCLLYTSSRKEAKKFEAYSIMDTPSGRSRTGILKGPDGRRKAPSPTNREKAEMTSTQRARRPGLFGQSASRIPI